MAWSEASASGEPGVLVMAMVSAPPAPRRLRHGDDVGALAGLRDREAGGAVEPELRAVDRGDRRAERGDRHAGRQFDRVFEEGRGMVGRAARHRRRRSAGRRSRSAVAGLGAARRRRRRAGAPPRRVSPAISRRIWVCRSSLGSASFCASREPQLGDEIIGVAAIDRAGELDDLAARQIGDALDVEAGRARRGTSSSARRPRRDWRREMRWMARTGRLPVFSSAA